MQVPPKPWPEDADAPDPTLSENQMGDPNTTLRPRGPEDAVPEPCGYTLVVYAGSQLGRLFPIAVGENTIGRAPTALISLLDEEVSRNHGIPVTAIATLDDVVATLRERPDLHDRIAAIEEYRRQYGA